MKINLKHGIDQLVFEMKQNDVIAIYGKPNKNYKDEDENVIFSYNSLKMRLTFYNDEDFKLGYIVASSPDIKLFDNKVTVSSNVIFAYEETNNRPGAGYYNNPLTGLYLLNQASSAA